MTDNEIIKALECFAIDKDFDETHCIGCAFEHQFCTANMSEDVAIPALDLINRQKAEIEELQKEYDKVYEQAEANILGNMADGGMSCHWCIEKHRKNAIKEFAERLNENSIIVLDTPTKDNIIGAKYVIDSVVLNNLVKEMVGDNNA